MHNYNTKITFDDLDEKGLSALLYCFMRDQKMRNNTTEKCFEFVAWFLRYALVKKLMPSSTSSQGAVFMYALMKQKDVPGKQEFKIHPERLMEIYQNWQIVLNFLFISNLMDAQLEPFKLFDFEGFDDLQFKGAV